MNILIPGLRNSGPDHWQTIWERRFPHQFLRVEQSNWEQPDAAAWTERMEQTLAPFQHQELLLIGHSIGCLAIVKWYQRYGHSIKGALLVAPSDAEREGYPDYITGFAPIPLEVLPFPSIVVGSTNDHVTSAERTAFFAECWGSERIMLPQAGHIEPSSGYGDWPEGLALIRSLERGLN